MEKEWFEQLTDAQKAKLKAMDGNVTVDQLTAFCKEEKLPLPDDLLEGAAGGEFLCTDNNNHDSIERIRNIINGK